MQEVVRVEEGRWPMCTCTHAVNSRLPCSPGRHCLPLCGPIFRGRDQVDRSLVNVIHSCKGKLPVLLKANSQEAWEHN